VNDEAALRENMMRLETAKAQLEGLSKQQELIQLAIEEHVKARETVKSLAKSAPGDELMIPVGADSYIYAKASERKDVVIGVGSDTSVQRGAEEAEKILDTRVEELAQAFQKVAEMAAQTEAAVQELTQKVQEQYEKFQAGPRA
jgi:prefoldin alpha subunit